MEFLILILSFIATLLLIVFLLKKTVYGLTLLIIWQFLPQYFSFVKNKQDLLLITAIGTITIIGLMYLSFFLKKIASKKDTVYLGDKKISFFMILLVLWSIVSAAYGILKGNNLYYVFGDLYWLLTLPLVYFLVINITGDYKIKRVFYSIISVILGFFLIDSFSYMLGKFDIGTHINGEGIPRMLSASAGYTFVIVPLSLGFWLLTYKKRERLFWNFSLLVSFFALVVSLTRTYWYATLLTIIAMFFIVSLKDKIKMHRIIPVLLLVFLLCNITLAHLSIKISSTDLLIKRFTNFHPSSKFTEVKDIVTYATKNPLAIFFGKGLGEEIKTWVVGAHVDEIKMTHFIHNNYARIFIETGIFGLLMYLSILYLAFKKDFILFKKTGANEIFIKSFSLGFIGVIMAASIGAIGTNTLYNILIYILIGLLVNLDRFKKYQLSL